MDQTAWLKAQTIEVASPALDHFTDDFYGDFYDFFTNWIRFKTITQQLTPHEFVLFLNVQQPVDGLAHYSYQLSFDPQLYFLPQASHLSFQALLAQSGQSELRPTLYQAANQQLMADLATTLKGKDEGERIQHFNQVLAQLYAQLQLDQTKIYYRLT
ncbi:MAG: hypothetical protein ACTIAG_02920 [Lactobacillus sp.]